jgi:RIO kinase 2
MAVSECARTQVEMGSKNHEVVPTSLVAQISGLRSGGVNKCIGELAKRNLIAKVQNAKCAWYVWVYILLQGLLLMRRVDVDDGYRLTYGGYDYLAMRAMSKRDTMYSVGNQIGVGKESGLLRGVSYPLTYPELMHVYRHLHCG